MRKLISIGILSIFLFNIGGFYLLFSVLQHEIQYEMEQEIEAGSKNEDLTLIIVPVGNNQGICWTKPNKEFRYKGEMFDVVKIKSFPGKKYYYCLNDNKEKQLISYFNTNHNTKKESEKRLKRNFNYSLYFEQFTIPKRVFPNELTFSAIGNFYTSKSIGILYPPPKSA